MSENVTQMQVITFATLLTFSLLMVVIGFYTSRHTKTLDGFLLGGRKIGAWMTAFAYGTSYFSAVIFIGYAGKNGWDVGYGSMWIGIGNSIFGCLLAWIVLAEKTRHMTHNLGVKTMPEFFESRYGCSAMKLYSAAIVFIFLVPYSSAVYKGLGSLFNTIYPNVPENVCMLIVAALTAIFLVLGGYVATVYTDFFQGIIMIAGTILLMIIVTINPKIGGIAEGYQKIKQIDPSLTNIFGGDNWSFLLTNILLTSFGTWGLPQMINKYYAIKDRASIKKATLVTTAFAAIIGVGAYYVGVYGRVYLDNTLPEGGYDNIVPQILLLSLGDVNMFTNFVLAIIMVLLLSASISTLSSIVLTSASAISVDLLPFVIPKFDSGHQMSITRILCIVFVSLSYIFATMKIAIIVSIMSFSWGVVSGSFIGPFLWGLYSKNTTKLGAWAGMLGGFVTIAGLTAYKTLTVDFKAAISGAPLYGVLAMAASILIVPIVSRLTAKLPEDIINKAFMEA